MRLRLSRPFVKYLIVGGTAFVVELGSFELLYYAAGWRLLVANAASFILGLLTSFGLNRLWTFSHGVYKKGMHHQFGYYFILAGLNLLATLGIVGALTRLGLWPGASKLLAMGITSLWNFVLFKRFIFRHQPSVEDGRP